MLRFIKFGYFFGSTNMGILSEKLTIPEPFSFGDMPKKPKIFRFFAYYFKIEFTKHHL